MEIEFDAHKDARNRRKHGVSLAEARELDWISMQIQFDDRSGYGEDRWIGVAPKGNRVYTLVFTVRNDDVIRPISLRNATSTEIRRYETQSTKA